MFDIATAFYHRRTQTQSFREISRLVFSHFRPAHYHCYYHWQNLNQFLFLSVLHIDFHSYGQACEGSLSQRTFTFCANAIHTPELAKGNLNAPTGKKKGGEEEMEN